MLIHEKIGEEMPCDARPFCDEDSEDEWHEQNHKQDEIVDDYYIGFNTSL